MAKEKIKKEKNSEVSDSKEFSFDQLSSTLDKDVKSGGGIISNMNFANEEFISSGIYILDALTSARIIEGGISNNRFTCIAGENSTGKTFLALNYCANAIKKGYSVIYIDSEGNINDKLIKNFGIDPTKFRLENQIGTLERFKSYMAKLLKVLEEQKAAGKKLPKLMFVIDSLANFPSEKEITDAEEGNDKADMGRNKALKSLFRIITTKLNLLNIPLIGISHGYMTMDLFPKFVVSGGSGILYNASVIIILSKAKLDEGDKDAQDLQSGIIVTAKAEKNRMAKPKKIKFEISFTSGANPFKGMDFLLTEENFEAVGIAKGKKKVNEETGEITIEPKGNNWYVRHLDKHVPTKNLYTPEVFTPEVIAALNPIVYDYFRYKSVEEINELNSKIEKARSEAGMGDDGDFLIDASDLTADDLFS